MCISDQESIIASMYEFVCSVRVYIVISICSVPRSAIFICSGSVPLNRSALIAFRVPCVPRFIDHLATPYAIYSTDQWLANGANKFINCHNCLLAENRILYPAKV